MHKKTRLMYNRCKKISENTVSLRSAVHESRSLRYARPRFLSESVFQHHRINTAVSMLTYHTIVQTTPSRTVSTLYLYYKASVKRKE